MNNIIYCIIILSVGLIALLYRKISHWEINDNPINNVNYYISIIFPIFFIVIGIVALIIEIHRL